MSLEERLALVEARLELAELVARYCHRIDARDVAGASALFSTEGTMSVPDGRVSRGRSEIESFLAVQLGRWQGTYHFVHSQVLDDIGTARPHGLVDAHAEHSGDGVCAYAGIRYSDVYVREPEGWRFASRELQIRYFLPWPELGSNYRHSGRVPL
jgi:hypothetical protein